MSEDNPAKVIPSDEGQVVSITKASLETPYLPPKFIEEYERIVPGSGQKMFDMVLKQQEINIDILEREMKINEENFQRIKALDQANIDEQQAIAEIRKQDVKIAMRGQIFAFILALLLMALSAFFAYLEHTKLALAPLTIIIGVMVVIFLRKSPPNNKDSEK